MQVLTTRGQQQLPVETKTTARAREGGPAPTQGVRWQTLPDTGQRSIFWVKDSLDKFTATHPFLFCNMFIERQLGSCLPKSSVLGEAVDGVWEV